YAYILLPSRAAPAAQPVCQETEEPGIDTGFGQVVRIFFFILFFGFELAQPAIYLVVDTGNAVALPALRLLPEIFTSFHQNESS
ncbi:MAG: hypothetical protein ACRDE2_17330, partial [Chitinophagaceae bacterium]